MYVLLSVYNLFAKLFNRNTKWKIKKMKMNTHTYRAYSKDGTKKNQGKIELRILPTNRNKLGGEASAKSHGKLLSYFTFSLVSKKWAKKRARGRKNMTKKREMWYSSHWEVYIFRISGKLWIKFSYVQSQTTKVTSKCESAVYIYT